ncbi:ABC transporter permease [Kitasatospora sp. NPDC002040]|uniref:ABC transporter permease n=1 Tax=Kitasatospora sp. NPDC002040 TaxID=3154661 RepID=UPI003317CE45
MTSTEPPARFGDLIASEWIKLRSLRSVLWTPLLVGLFVLGTAATAALADRDNPRVETEYLPFDAFPPTGWVTLMLAAGSIGAVTSVGEYSSGLIRTTTVAVPARASVVLAKAVVAGALWTALGAVLSVASFFLSQALLGSHGTSITHPGVLRGLLACTLVGPVCALVGLGLGVLIRHSATTMVVTTFTLLMLPMFFSTRRQWSADVNGMMTTSAWRRLVQTWEPGIQDGISPATVAGSWAAYALWPLLLTALAVLLVRRRDV